MRLGGLAGFTIIELVVSMAILTMLLSLTIPFFRDFRANQELEQAAQTLKTNLRFAQSQAFGGIKPNECGADELIGWFITFEPFSNAKTYSIHARCGPTVVPIRFITMPQGVTASLNPFGKDILFQPINRSVVFVDDAGSEDPPYTSSGDEMDITLIKDTRTATVTVRTTGDIE